MNYFVNNREVIKDLCINTGTTAVPVWSKMCTTSEVSFNTEFDSTDFSVWCDAIKRHLITGAGISIETNVKLDINNTAIQSLLSKVHALLVNGTIAQFNNVEVKFSLLTGVNDNVLEYTTYKVDACLDFSDLGGSAEEEGEFSLNISVNGKATVVVESL